MINLIENENGKYEIDESQGCTVKILVEPSQQWLEENKPNLNLIKQKAIQDIKAECKRRIEFEFYSDCEGELKRYPAQLHDQQNAMGIFLLLEPTDEIVIWKTDDEIVGRPFQVEAFRKMIKDLKTHITRKTVVCQTAVSDILQATTKEEIKNIINSIIW